ncbi:Dna2/Cas4 domain-containing protein [Paenibacillus sediminis]|uniref:Dna2/Cas4 domain-containing protein n=1 Tax=Paenibacillus sediminis TaxID=664909 RepID=UPI0039EC89B1
MNEQGQREVEEAMKGVESVLQSHIPPFRKLPYCSKCAYKDFCYAGEEEEGEV